MPTLDDMIRKSAEYCSLQSEMFENDDPKSGVYLTTQDATNYKNMLIGYVNDSIRKTAREKLLLITEETLYANGALSKTLIEVAQIQDPYGYNVDFDIDANGDLAIPDIEDYDYAVVRYYYMPAELTNLTDVYPFNAAGVDYTVHCEYAAHSYFSERKKYDRASYWGTKYTTDYANIVTDLGQTHQAKEVW